jgi:hypothetical protein
MALLYHTHNHMVGVSDVQALASGHEALKPSYEWARPNQAYYMA